MDTTPDPQRTRRLVLAALALLVLLTGGLVVAVGTSGPDGGSASAEDAGPSLDADDRDPGRPPSTTTPATGDPTAASGSSGGSSAGTGPESEPSDDDDFPGLPEDDEDPGPWVPPTSVDDFAPNPIVLDLVAELPTDPELGPGGQGQAGDGFSNGAVQCDGDCIDRATVEPRGTSATFRVHTTVPARIWVVLDSPAVQDSSSRVRDYEVAFDGLEADTLYNVTLVAEDQHGNLDHRYGQFRTLRRQVVVEFTSIDVVDDADHWGKGEVEWFFDVNGTWIEDFHRGVAKVKSGRSIHLDGRRMAIDGSGPELTLTVQGIEHDKGVQFCSAGSGPFSPGGGDISGCRDYATATAVFDLDELDAIEPALPSAGHDAVFMLRTRAHYLEFDVYGTIDVEYV